MLGVRAERCTGCGACEDVCPSAAIRLEGGVARIDTDLCDECRACVEACPQGAIESVAYVVPVVEGEVVAPEREIVVRPHMDVSTRATARPWMSAVGAALVSMGREVLPRVAASLLEAWERRQVTPAPGPEPTEDGALSGEVRGRGHRRHRRQGPGR